MRIIALVLALYSVPVLADCTYTYMNGGTVICQTCCNGPICNTRCWER